MSTALAGLLAGSLGAGAGRPIAARPVAGPAATGAPMATLDQPPDLQRLVAASGSLRLSTAIVRDRSTSSFSGRTLPGSTSIVHWDFVHHSAVEVFGFGKTRVSVRVFGRDLYLEVGRRAHGGRRWVMVRAPRSLGASPIDTSAITAAGVVSSVARQATRGSVVKVSEGTPTTLMGRPAQPFQFSFTVSMPPIHGRTQSIQASVVADFASNGLLLREVTTLDLLGISNVEQDDLIGVNVPMRIRRPARSDTTVVSPSGFLRALG